MNKKAAFSLLLLFCIKAFAQNVNIVNFQGQTNVFAPSPNASALGKFGEIPVDMHTGIPNINVPAFSWKSNHGKLSLDVNLTYHAGGNKVEDVASSTGLGWALNGGAMVTRSVRGLPDDQTFGYLVTDPLPDFNTTTYTGGYYHNSPYPSTEYTTSDTSRNAIIAPFNLNGTETSQISSLMAGSLDPEQDLFYYTVGATSGKFVLDKDGTVKKIDDNNFIISVQFVGSSKVINSFQITTDEGIVYNLTEKETSTVTNYTETISYDNSTESSGFNQTQDTRQTSPFTSAFYVSSIIDKANQDTIFFTYNSHAIHYQSGFGETIEYYDSNDPALSNSTQNKISSKTYNYNTNDITQLAIKKISLPDYSTIDFSYNMARADLTGDSALTAISMSDYLGNQRKLRLQYDYFIADGLGAPDWSYTPTTTINYYTPQPDHFNKRLKLLSTDWVNSTGTDSLRGYQFIYNATPLPARNSKAIDYWGYYVGPNRSSSTLIPQLNTITTIPTSEGLQTGYYYNAQNFFLGGADRTPDSIYDRACVLEKIIYPTGGNSKFLLETNDIKGPIYPNSLKRNYVINTPQDSIDYPRTIVFNDRSETGTNFFVNFTRVNSDGSLYIPPPYDPNEHQTCFAEAVSMATITITVESTDNTVSKTENFNAVDSNEGQAWVYFVLPLNKTYTVSYHFNDNSDPCLQGVYFKMQTVVGYACNIENDLVGGLRIKSQIDSSGANSTMTQVNYKYTDTTGYSSGALPVVPNNEIHTRTEGVWNTCDQSGTQGFPVFMGYADYKSRTSSTTQTLGYSFGGNVAYLQVEKSHYASAEGSLGKEVSIFSNPVLRNYHDVYPYRSIQLIDWASGHPITHLIYDKNGILQQKDSLFYNDFIDTFNTVKNRSLKFAIIRNDRCEGLDNLTYRRFVAFTYYPMTGYSKLIAKRTAEFSGTDSLITRTTFGYDGYKNLVQISSDNSKGEQTGTDVFYPYNFSTTSLSTLESANDVSTQVLSRNYIWHGVYKWQTGGSGVNYTILTNNMVKASQFYSFKAGQSIDITSQTFSNSSIPQSSYDQSDGQITKFDSKGNAVEIVGRDGIRTSIIYGYKFTKPVAKIVGASYDDAVSKLSTVTLTSLQTISDPSTLRAKLDEIRQGYSSNHLVQVSTFTYVPLIGIESSTDERGKTTYYTYDDFGRLVLVRDQNSNILKKICYSYAGQASVCGGSGISCNSSTCSGPDKKCINGVCETGTKVCTSSVRQGGANWLNTYHYQWSDNSVSQDYTEIGSGCFLLF